jgi:hypothetical protein
MSHCSDDDLVLHYYRESAEADAHIAACAACAGRASELAALLETVTDEVPERGERYGAEVWYRVRPHLEPRRSWFSMPAVRWSLAAAATVALVTTGFVAGRFSTRPVDISPFEIAQRTPQAGSVGGTRGASDAADSQLARRVLLLTVADHLERSDRVLTDIMNTPGESDISAEQQWAGDLIAANRLYRQDALDADESSIASVLDELERALLDIVHRPADAHADLEQIRERIDSAALLFKVRVMTNELRQRQFRPSNDSVDRDPRSAPGDRSTTPIS